MSKTCYFPESSENTNSGIDITWTKSTQMLNIGGWYDNMTGIRNECLSLQEFFSRLGITEKDCRKAFLKESKVAHQSVLSENS